MQSFPPAQKLAAPVVTRSVEPANIGIVNFPCRLAVSDPCKGLRAASTETAPLAPVLLTTPSMVTGVPVGTFTPYSGKRGILPASVPLGTARGMVLAYVDVVPP